MKKRYGWRVEMEWAEQKSRREIVLITSSATRALKKAMKGVSECWQVTSVTRVGEANAK